MDFYIWLGIFAIFVVIGFLLDREIYFYEGVHLGYGYRRGYMIAGRGNIIRANALPKPITRTATITTTPMILLAIAIPKRASSEH